MLGLIREVIYGEIRTNKLTETQYSRQLSEWRLNFTPFFTLRRRASIPDKFDIQFVNYFWVFYALKNKYLSFKTK